MSLFKVGNHVRTASVSAAKQPIVCFYDEKFYFTIFHFKMLWRRIMSSYSTLMVTCGQLGSGIWNRTLSNFQWHHKVCGHQLHALIMSLHRVGSTHGQCFPHDYVLTMFYDPKIWVRSRMLGVMIYNLGSGHRRLERFCLQVFDQGVSVISDRMIPSWCPETELR